MIDRRVFHFLNNALSPKVFSFRVTQNRNYAEFAAAQPRVCIVGTGPAGIYTAKYLRKHFSNAIQIYFYDKCLYPYGLLRYGVAPDHPELRLAAREFDKLCPSHAQKSASSLSRFFNNTTVVGAPLLQSVAHGSPSHSCPTDTISSVPMSTVPRTLHLDALQKAYDAVVLAIGAERPSALQLRNSHLKGIIRGGDFMKWCNGYTSETGAYLGDSSLEYPARGPGGSDESVDGLLKSLTFLSSSTGQLDHDFPLRPRVVIIGLGNVALDVARLLLKSPSSLRLCKSVSEALRSLSVPSVTIVGRRHLGTNHFSPAELREVLELPNVAVTRNLSSLEPANAPTRRSEKVRHMFENLPESDSPCALENDALRPRRLHFVGDHVPTAYVASANNASRLACVEFTSSNTKESLLIPADLVVECVGFEQPTALGFPLTDNMKRLQLDSESRDSGCLLTTNKIQTIPLSPVYAVGWCNTGATGAVPETILNALHVADTMKRHFDAKRWTAKTCSSC